MPIQLFKGREERKQKQRIADIAKADAQTFHDLEDLDTLGLLTDTHISRMAERGAKTHTFSDTEKLIYLPAFEAEVHLLEIPFIGL